SAERRVGDAALCAAHAAAGQGAAAQDGAGGHAMKTDRPMAYIGAFFLSRWTLITFNTLISYVCVLAAIDVIMMIVNGQHFAVQVEVMDGIGVILIGYGVALEERKALRELAGPLSRINRDWEAAIDKHCHAQGLLLLVFGLFVEMCIACIEIPNHVVDTG